MQIKLAALAALNEKEIAAPNQKIHPIDGLYND